MRVILENTQPSLFLEVPGIVKLKTDQKYQIYPENILNCKRDRHLVTRSGNHHNEQKSTFTSL